MHPSEGDMCSIDMMLTKKAGMTMLLSRYVGLMYGLQSFSIKVRL